MCPHALLSQARSHISHHMIHIIVKDRSVVDSQSDAERMQDNMNTIQFVFLCVFRSNLLKENIGSMCMHSLLE